MPKKFNIETGAFEDVDDMPANKRGKFIEILQPNTILNGVGEPSKSLGEDGDFYIETGSWEIYLKEDGSWGEGVSLRPSDGKDGRDGKDGEHGLHGEHGLDGERGTDGNGIVDIARKGDSLVIELSNGEYKTFELPVPANGKDGRGILSIEQSKDGSVHVFYTDGTKTKLTLPQATSGREIELGSSSTHFQWRYKGEKEWRDLAPIPKAKGRMGGGGGTHKGHNIMDEGVALDQRTRLDFVGVGVAVTDDAANDKTIVTIGGGGSNITAKDEGSTLTTAMTSIDFVGSAVTATNSGGDVTVTISGGSPAGSDGQFQYNNGGAFGGVSTASFNDTTLRVGINNTSPDGVFHIKEGTYDAVPEPTGTVTLSETDIGSGTYTNDGNSFDVRVYTYKVVEGVTLYSSTYITSAYADDIAGDHNYNVLVEMSDALPAGADGYRAFVQFTNNVPEVVWSYNQYFQFTDLDVTINASPTAGTPVSGTVVYKAIVENAETWIKNSNLRLMDSSENTKAIWDEANERWGVGTDSPTQFVHFKSTTTTLPTNPSGTVTPTQVSESEDDPYNADGTTHAYRVYTYKVVGGQIILSNTFLSGSFTDDGSETLYYVNIAMSAAVPSGADGYFVVKSSLNYSTVNYWIGGQNIEDRSNYTTGTSAQFSTTIGRTLIDTANIEAVHSGSRKWFYDSTDGSFDTLKVKTRNTYQYGLRIECINGQGLDPISVVNHLGTNLFRVTTGGAISFSGGITATTGTFSAGLTGTTATFSSNVSVGGTLAVTSAATFTSTVTARTGTFTASSSGSVGLVVNGTTGQTADLQQWRATSGGTILAYINASGNLLFNNGTSNRIFFGANGTAIPSASSVGQKIQLSGALATVGVADYALGVESGFMWLTSGGGYKFYNNAASALLTLSSAGIVTATNEVQSPTAFRLTAFGAYVGVSAGSRCTFGNGSGVSTFGTGTTSHVVSLIEAPSGQTADIQQWRVNSSAVASMSAGGDLTARSALWSRTATAVSASSAGETIIGVTDTSAPRTITLSTTDLDAGRIMYIKDESGAAGTNNITVDTQGAETIDGAASIAITANYGVLRLYSNGTNWFTL